MEEASVWSVPFMAAFFGRGVAVMTTAVQATLALSVTSDGTVHEPETTIESIPYLPQEFQQLCRGGAVDAPASIIHHLLIHAFEKRLAPMDGCRRTLTMLRVTGTVCCS